MKLKSLCKAVDEYTKSCGICKDNATHKPKPKVCLPMANNFNDVYDVYTDASYANLPDLASQRGTIAFMEDETERKNIVEFKSKRIKRVCRSTFSAELLACNAAVDYAL